MGGSTQHPWSSLCGRSCLGLSPSVVLWPCSDTTLGGRRPRCLGTHSIILTTTASLSLLQSSMSPGTHSSSLCQHTGPAATPGEPQNHSNCLAQSQCQQRGSLQHGHSNGQGRTERTEPWLHGIAGTGGTSTCSHRLTAAESNASE